MNPSAKRYRRVGASRTAYIMIVGCLTLGGLALWTGVSAQAAPKVPAPEAKTAPDARAIAEPVEGQVKAGIPAGGVATEIATGGATGGATTGGEATNTEAPERAAPVAAVATGSSADRTFARITSESCHIRCFASNLSRVYEEPLPKGTVVEVGEEVGEYRRVILPLGVVGFVSTRFTDAPVDGLVRTNKKLVSFRSRPTPKNRAEAPVQTLPLGTELRYIAEAGDWWKVRFATTSAYLPIKEIVVIDAAGATAAEASYKELASAHEGAWREAVTKFETKARIINEKLARTKALEAIRVAFNNESKKPLRKQSLEPLKTQLEELMAKLPEKAPLLVHARYLDSAIERQQVFVDADSVINGARPVPPPAKVIVAPTPEDKLAEKVHVIGWLRHDPRQPGAAKYRLEKGGRVVAFLFSSNMRYQLGIFDGVEIGVRGVRSRDSVVPFLEVQSIEVYSHGN